MDICTVSASSAFQLATSGVYELGQSHNWCMRDAILKDYTCGICEHGQA